MSQDDTITYTGWTVSADRLRAHSHSEAALHRWDLVGDDDISIRLLSDPTLLTHALAAFAAIPALLEAQRWVDAGFTSQPVRFRSGQPDVLVTPGEGLSTPPAAEAAAVIELEPHERLLVLWGRTPARLRDPQANAENVDDALSRLVNHHQG